LEVRGGGSDILKTMEKQRIDRVFGFLILPVVALIVLGCGSDRPAADGDLDCETELTWTEEGSVPEGTAGLAEAADAVDAYLEPFMENHGGEIVMVDDARGSLLLNRDEVVVGHATEMSNGGFLVLTGAGCEGFDRSAG
jgi:hypothetical protein